MGYARAPAFWLGMIFIFIGLVATLTWQLPGKLRLKLEFRRLLPGENRIFDMLLAAASQ